MIRKILILLAVTVLSGCMATGYDTAWRLPSWGSSKPATGTPTQMSPANPAGMAAPTPTAARNTAPNGAANGIVAANASLYTDTVQREPLPGNNGLSEAAVFGQAQTPAAPAPASSAMPAVKIGLLLPLSGAQKGLGQAMLQASQLALFDMGYTSFELVPRDTKGTAEGARLAAENAVGAGAKLLLGPVFSGETKAAASVAQHYNVNMISFSTDWNLAGGNTFVMGFLPFSQVSRVVEYAASQGLSRFGVLAPDSDYGNAVIAAYRNAAGGLGIGTVDIVQFPSNAGDISGTIRTMSRYESRTAGLSAALAPFEERLKQNPGDKEARAAINSFKGSHTADPAPFDAILIPVGGEKAASIANSLSYYDMPPQNVRRLGTGLWDDSSLAIEANLEGAWFAAPPPESRRGFESRYKQTYGATPPRVASLAYDATALAAVLARNGVNTGYGPSFDRDSLTNPNGFAGVDGIFRFRQDNLVERGLAVLELSNGGLRVVDPAPRTFQTSGGF